MTTATNAILFYGFCGCHEDMVPQVGEDTFFGMEDEYTHRLALALGMPPEDLDEMDEEEHDIVADKAREFLDDRGLIVGTHCTDSVAMPYVALGRLHEYTRRGYPEPVSELIGQVPIEEELHLLRKVRAEARRLFHEEQHDDAPHWSEIGWWLVSYWETYGSR